MGFSIMEMVAYGPGSLLWPPCVGLGCRFSCFSHRTQFHAKRKSTLLCFWLAQEFSTLCMTRIGFTCMDEYVP